ncbi:MAG: tannase/feruloyl esterase family alpha/beta hydrolase, partial [Sphingomonadales bacterium]
MTARSGLLSACAIGAAALLATPATASGKAAPQTDAARCEGLAKLRLKDTTIVTATAVAAGAAKDVYARDAASLPAFCRVIARVRSDADSDIGVELWLPMDRWTGTFHGNGNGGFAGSLAAGHASMATGLRNGFATAVTDTGTSPATMLDGDPLIGHPRKWKDWGRLSTHVMTVTGKALTNAFYGRKASKSYYTGCSTGGQQGLIEALYYPADYDGILVGAPVINRTWGHAAVLWNYAAAHRTPGSLLSDAKLKLLNSKAIAACGRLSGGLASDPFIADPLSCRFDPGALTCQGTSTDQCLTPDE